VKDCQAQGIGVLPVHDSLIVPAGYAEQAADAMAKAFASRFPDSNCEVRIKSGPDPTNGRKN
jgi:hypothetical protein